jgi:Glutamate synthase domain 3
MGIPPKTPELRCRFKGKPEDVENFMRFIAQELREIMAKLGISTVDSLVGRRSLLRQRDDLQSERAKTVLAEQLLDDGKDCPVHFDPKAIYQFHLEKTADMSILLPAFTETLKTRKPAVITVEISSQNRTFGTILGSEITKTSPDGLPDDTVTICAFGGGGQSFGAFIPKGLTIRLSGDSNDYFGKGLSGGRLIVKPPENSAINPGENIIIGNVALYGATSGEAYINGMAGERFCVRNSGAKAVVEGVGDHGCEYMTGGCVVILGSVGKNFAAGMSGGIAYVFDDRHELYLNLNKELVSMEAVTAKYDAQELHTMIEHHVKETGSPRGKVILENWEETLPLFKKIVPNDYRFMLSAISRLEEKGISREAAELDAFYALQQGKE